MEVTQYLNNAVKTLFSFYVSLFLRPDDTDGRGPVGERVPLSLDAGTVCVEGFADADHFQTRLIGQLGQKL